MRTGRLPPFAFLALWASLAVLAPRNGEAYFRDWDLDPVTRGAAGAGTGRFGGLAYGWLNPASLARLTGLELRASTGRLAWGLSDGSVIGEQQLGAGWPLGPGVVAGGWQGRGLDQGFREDRLAFGYALDLQDSFWLSAGMGVEWWRLNQPSTLWTDTNTSIKTLTPSALAVSVGLLLQPTAGLTLGASLWGFNRPSLSFLDETVPVPLTVRLGLSSGGGGWIWMIDGLWREGAPVLSAGAEVDLAEGAVVRGGLKGGLMPGFPLSVYEIAGGTSLTWPHEWGTLRFDYGAAWPLNGLSGTSGTHRIAVSLLRSIGGSSAAAGGPAAPVTTLTALPFLSFPPRFLLLELSIEQERDLWLERLASIQNESAVMHRAAFLCAVTGRLADAQLWYQRLMALDPAYERLCLRLLHALRFEPDRVQDILMAGYERAIAAADVPSEIWLTFGWLASRAGRYADAVIPYRRWLEAQTASGFDPQQHGGAVIWMIQSMAENGQGELAEQGLAQLTHTAEGAAPSAVADHPLVWEAVGKLAAARQQLDLARRAFTRAHEISGTPHTHYQLGIVLLRLRRWDDAYLALQAAAAAETPAGAITDGFRAFCRYAASQELAAGETLEQGEWRMRDALDQYRRVLKYIPDHPEALARIARVQQRAREQVEEQTRQAEKHTSEGFYDKAVDNWLNVLKADPDHTRPAQEIARLAAIMKVQIDQRLEEKQFRTAYQLLTGLQAVPELREDATQRKQAILAGLIREASASQQQEAFPESKKLWLKILELEPAQPEALTGLPRATLEGRQQAESYLAKSRQALFQKDFPGATANVRYARARDPEVPGLETYERELQKETEGFVQRRWEEASKAAKAGDDRKALEAANELLRVDPQHAQATALLGQLKQKKQGRVKSQWESARRLDDQFQPDQALAAIKELLTIQPDHPEALALQTAIRQRQALAKESAPRVKTLKLQADILYGEGKIREATKLLEEALTLDHYNAEIRRTLDDAKRELKE